MALRPRCLGSSDGWYWIVPCVGHGEELRRDDQRDERHDLEVRREGAERLHHRRVAERSRADQREPGREGGLRQRVRPRALRRGVDRHHVVAPLRAAPRARPCRRPAGRAPRYASCLLVVTAAPAAAGGSASSRSGWYPMKAGRIGAARSSARRACGHGQERAHHHRALRGLTDLSARLLRRLDERGLLSPVVVDADTRYRVLRPRARRASRASSTSDARWDSPSTSSADLIASRRAWRPAQSSGAAPRDRGREARRAEPPVSVCSTASSSAATGCCGTNVGIKDAPAVLVMSATGSERRTHPHDPWALEHALRRVGARAAVTDRPPGRGARRRTASSCTTRIWPGTTRWSFEVCIPVPRPSARGPGSRVPRSCRPRASHSSPSAALRHDLERPRRTGSPGSTSTDIDAAGPVREVGIVVGRRHR